MGAGGLEWVFNHCKVLFLALKEIKMISDMKNVRSVEQSVIAVGIHLSSLETWLQDNSSSNPV